VERFRGREQAHGLDGEAGGDLSGPYLVEYESDVYWTVLVVSDEAFGTGTETPY
jgi:hypothetical protein